MADKIEIAGRTINVNGSNIFYLESGKGTPACTHQGNSKLQPFFAGGPARNSKRALADFFSITESCDAQLV